MPEHEREDGARMKEVVAWVNAGAALGAAALLGGYLLVIGDGVSPSGSTPSIESPEDAAPPSAAADVDTRAPDVPPPAAEGPTGTAPEDASNLARPDRRRSAEAAAPRLPADTDARAAGAAPPAAEGRTARAAEDSLNLARADRRRIQAGLTASGREPGPADGVFGAGTRSAIREWQAGRGWPATGYLNAAEAEELLALGRGRGEGRRAAARRPRADVEDSGGRLTVRDEPASRIELDGAAEDPTARAAEDSPNLARSDRRRSAEAAAPRPAADTDARVPGASPPPGTPATDPPATTPAAYSRLYWVDYDAGEIQRSNLDGSQVQTIVSGLESPEGIALDVGSGKVYWTEQRGVKRSNLDGSQIESLGTASGSDIALDVTEGKTYLAYWTEKIYRTGLGGSPVETLVNEAGASEVIALDLSRGKMYWGGWRGEEIRRANLDGSQIETIVTGVEAAQDLAVDEAGGKLYWASRAGVQRANLDGSQVETLFTVSSYGIALDLAAGKIYWSEWQIEERIRRANLDGSQIQTIVTGLEWPQDVALSP